jgi:hypothetical protein
MAQPTPVETKERVRDEKGARRLAIGAWFGLIAGFLAVVVPVAVIEISKYSPIGWLTLASTSVLTSSLVILVGAVLFAVSMFFYRSAFSKMRKFDPLLWGATILCLVGSIGFVLLVIATGYLSGHSDTLAGCLKGPASGILSCIESGEPFGGYTVLVGFLCAWLGGLGIVVGLLVSSGHLGRGTIGLGGVVYLLFLIVALIPFIGIIVEFPGIRYILLLLPILVIAAPALVLSGGKGALKEMRSAPPSAPA